MTFQEIIESGLLEMYCMGATTGEQNAFVEAQAAKYPQVKYELERIEAALTGLSQYKKVPGNQVRKNIFDIIYNAEAKENGLPPVLSEKSSILEWKIYLESHHICKPSGTDLLYITEFSTTKNITSYVVWAQPGACVEEIHNTETERLFMLQGTCTIEFNGTLHNYAAGDFVEIRKNTTHKATATGEEIMILIGQRLAV